MESIFYSVQEEIEKLKTVGMLEGKMTPDSYQKIKKYLFVKPLNKKNHSLEMEDAVHEDVGDIACVLYMMRSNTNEYFTGIKIKNIWYGMQRPIAILRCCSALKIRILI